MALVKKEACDKVEVVNMDTIPMLQCRHAVWVEDDETGEVFGGKQYHRHVVVPTDDVTNEDAQIKALATAVFTQDVKDAYFAKQLIAETEQMGQPTEGAV